MSVSWDVRLFAIGKWWHLQDSDLFWDNGCLAFIKFAFNFPLCSLLLTALVLNVDEWSSIKKLKCLLKQEYQTFYSQDTMKFIFESCLNRVLWFSQVIQAVFFGVCVLTDLSSLLTKGSASMEQERQLKKLIGLRDWMMAVLAFPVGVVRKHQWDFSLCICTLTDWDLWEFCLFVLVRPTAREWASLPTHDLDKLHVTCCFQLKKMMFR